MTYNEKTSVEKAEMLVRFPNESYPVEVPGFRLEDFNVTIIMQDEVFGKWKGIYIAITRVVFERIKPQPDI